VHAIFQPGDYPIGLKVTDAAMDALNFEPHAVSSLELHDPATDSGSNSTQLREVII